MRSRDFSPILLIGTDLAGIAQHMGGMVSISERPDFGDGVIPPALPGNRAQRVMLGYLRESEEPPKKRRKFRHNRRW